jgi:hypothetical protein
MVAINFIKDFYNSKLLAETSSRGARGKIKGIIEKERLKDLTAKPPLESSIKFFCFKFYIIIQTIILIIICTQVKNLLELEITRLAVDALGLNKNCNYTDPTWKWLAS